MDLYKLMLFDELQHVKGEWLFAPTWNLNLETWNKKESCNQIFFTFALSNIIKIYSYGIFQRI